jgi:hypothetical protein
MPSRAVFEKIWGSYPFHHCFLPAVLRLASDTERLQSHSLHLECYERFYLQVGLQLKIMDPIKNSWQKEKSNDNPFNYLFLEQKLISKLNQNIFLLVGETFHQFWISDLHPSLRLHETKLSNLCLRWRLISIGRAKRPLNRPNCPTSKIALQIIESKNVGRRSILRGSEYGSNYFFMSFWKKLRRLRNEN